MRLDPVLMGWLGIMDADGGRFDPRGLAGPGGSMPDTPALARGSIVLEVAVAPSDVPENLIRFSAKDPWPTAFILRHEPKGGLRLLQRQGGQTLEYLLRGAPLTAATTLRVTYTWDAPARTARLALTDLATGDTHMAGFLRPFPLFAADLERIVAGQGVKRHPGFAFLGIADHAVPFGPAGGFGPQTPVQTPKGPRKAKSLRHGDEVSLEGGDTARVLHAATTDWPARGQLAPVLLRAPHYGLDEDILTSAEQHVMLSGPEVEYLFGASRVTARAGDLADGQAVIFAPGLDTVQYTHLLLDRPVPVRVGGLLLGTFRADPLRDCAEGHLLTGLPKAQWPEVSPADPPPCLQSYEAQSYCRMRAA